MRFWHYVETREIEPFTVILEWTYEDIPLRDVYDDTVFDIADMEDRCNRHVDTHYVARVRVLFAGHELGSNTLGSCYAEDCDPADNMSTGMGGQLEDMIEEAIEEATERLTELKQKIAAIA